MQTIFITGGIGRDAEIRSTQNGDQVCSFNVGVGQGFGDRKKTNWFRVSIWGKRGASLQPYLLKGGKVAVTGELEIGEYEGKPQYNIRANEVDLMSKRDGAAGPSGGGASRTPADLDDEVPFLTAADTDNQRKRVM